jgi:hypothetical protein
MQDVSTAAIVGALRSTQTTHMLKDIHIQYFFELQKAF